jgi:hypothetical protein
MTRLNCPNCGAPIDIHRRSCEYCGTPYERNEEKTVIYADNAPFYIHQEPIKNIDPIEFQKLLLAEENRRLRNQLNASIMNVNNMHGFGTIEECLNSIPRVESNTSNPCGVPDIREDPVCPEHSMLKDILLLLAMFTPVIVIIFLKVFNII